MNFSELFPEVIFDAMSEQGYKPTGQLFPLNSYENRVYEIGVEDGPSIVAKFYRVGRWSAQAIAEEHQFLDILYELEIPVVKPISLSHPSDIKETMGQIDDMYFAIYPKFGGRENPDINLEDRKWLGRLLARLHNAGEAFKARHRLTLNADTYGYENLDYILDQEFLPLELAQNLETSILHALELTDDIFGRGVEGICVHGDCHLGNILWNHNGPHLVDFDDMLIAPPVQDIWMLFHGDKMEVSQQREAFFEGYETFRGFDYSSLRLSEPLRTLRIIRHTAWIGQRYGEEIFKRAFPYYQERKYWEEFLLNIKEQISLLQEIN